MYSDECVHMILHNSVSGVAHRHCGLSSVWVAVSMVVMGACLMDMALDTISGMLAAGFVVVAGSNVATAGGCSGCETRGCRACRGSVG
jgi:hypothetical protein